MDYMEPQVAKLRNIATNSRSMRSSILQLSSRNFTEHFTMMTSPSTRPNDRIQRRRLNDGANVAYRAAGEMAEVTASRISAHT